MVQITPTMTGNSSDEILPNPYYPLGTYIANYSVNEWSVPLLLGIFFGACGVLFASTYTVVKRTRPGLTRNELLTLMWFVLSGSIHIIFEGYYAFNFATIGSKQTLLGQLWKEYAFSDSRYLTQNSFVLCMETVTSVFWGPGCFLVAALIYYRHPLRLPLQMVVSMGQFYGDVLYYATGIFDDYVLGITNYRPEPFYFWFYFVFMNFFWIVIPGLLIYQSIVRSASAIAKVQRWESCKDGEGAPLLDPEYDGYYGASQRTKSLNNMR